MVSSRATVGVNLASVAILLGSVGQPAFQSIITMVNIALQNAMACRVFRLLKLGHAQNTSDVPGDPTTVIFGGDSTLPQSLPVELPTVRKESAISNAERGIEEGISSSQSVNRI